MTERSQHVCGLFEYPAAAAFGRVLPKTKIFAFGKVSRRLKDEFARRIVRIVWQYKLAPETINLPAAPGVPEIQVFSIELKPDVEDLSHDLLRCIDMAIGFPIIFEVTGRGPQGACLKTAAAYKRPSEADSSKWVVGDYFSSVWLPTDTRRSPLPVTLNLGNLYERMLRALMPWPGRQGESLGDLVERHRMAALKQREVDRLQSQLSRQRQFNRKVEINRDLRNLKTELEELKR